MTGPYRDSILAPVRLDTGPATSAALSPAPPFISPLLSLSLAPPLQELDSDGSGAVDSAEWVRLPVGDDPAPPTAA